MKAIPLKFIALALSFNLSNSVSAIENPTFNSNGFTENCGQLKNQFGELNTAVKYIWNTGKNLNVQLKSNGLSYDFYQRTGENKIAFHRLDMYLIDSNTSAHLEVTAYAPGQSNYINTRTDEAINDVNMATGLKVREVYPSVDWAVNLKADGNLKYDFIAKNAQAMKKIKLAYAGFDRFELCDGALHFELGNRTIIEHIPASWIDETGESIAVSYQIHSQNEHALTITFVEDEPCNWDGTLIIDPEAEFEWGTYYGDSNADMANSVSVDSLGNVFVVGATQGLEFIASEGSHQGEFAGGNTDAYLVKFNQHGLRHWATYIGGDGDDSALSIHVERYQTIYIAGQTNSSNFVHSDSTYQIVHGGGNDGFLACFDRYGHLKWDTYLGGSGEDLANSCKGDSAGNVFVSGYTNTPGFLGNDSISPLLPAQGMYDGYIAQFNNQGALTWCTYFGGPNDDFITGLAIDSALSVVATGYTNSPTGIATSGAFQPAYAGGLDGFILKIDSTYTLQWATYIGGTGDDKSNGVLALANKIIIVGSSNSDLALADTNSFQAAIGGGSDAILLMLQTDGTFDRFTYIGGSGDDEGMAIANDYSGDIYITGTTRSDSVMASADQPRDSLLGEQDAFITKFNLDGARIWGTYHGGEGNETALGIAVFGYTAVYPVGTTNSSLEIALDGPYDNSHQNNFSGGETDAFIARYTQILSTPPTCICSGDCDDVGGGGGGGGSGGGNSSGGSSGPPPIGICIGDSILLSIGGGSLGSGAQWIWYQDTCATTDNFIGEGNSIWVSPTVTTSYFVRGESVHCVTRCFGATVHVDYPPTVTASALDSICPGTTLLLFAEGAYSYQWTGPNEYTSDQEFPIIDSVSSMAAGIYDVIGSTQFGCRDTASVSVYLFDSPQFQLTSTPTSCHGSSDGSIQFMSNDSTITEIFWHEFPTLDSTLVVDNLYAGLYTVSATNYIGCQSLDTISVNQPKALIDSLYVLPSYCDRPNGSTQVFASGGTEPYLAIWSDGEDSDLPLNLLGMYGGSYTIVVSDSMGCVDSAYVFIPNLGHFSTVIEEDTLTLEYLAIGSIDYFTLPDVNIVNYYWTPAEAVSCQTCPNPEINPAESMDIQLLLISEHGCTSADSIHVVRILPPPSAFIPNRFSPNGDGLNDELCVLSWRMETYKLQVFDRTGTLVFESTSQYEQCWDGNKGGLPINGPLIYTFEAVLEENKHVQENGQLFILR